jgi:hypothetical protein
MKNALLAIATAAAVLTAAPLLAGTSKADPVRLAQADVDVRIGGRGGPGVVVGTPRRYRHGVVVTDGGPIAVPSPCGSGATARGSRAPSGSAAEGRPMRT